MAKKINTEEKPQNEADDTLQTEAAGAAETVSGTEPAHAGTASPAEPQKPAEENRKGSQTPDAHALDLLKKFPGYPSLYIDAQGGIFSPDTPAAIRGKAALYRNPFYNELKDKS